MCIRDSGNSVRATGGMNASKTVWQDENTFAEEAGVEKTLASAAETYADDETVTALAQTVKMCIRDRPGPGMGQKGVILWNAASR